MTITAEQLAELKAAFAEYDYGEKIALPIETARALIAAAEEVEKLRGEIESARHIMRDTLWMAHRYADGRDTYTREILKRAIESAAELGAVGQDNWREPIHADDPLGAYSRDLSEEEYRRIIAERRAIETWAAHKRKEGRDAAFAAGKREGIEAAAKTAKDALAKLVEEGEWLGDEYIDGVNDSVTAIRALIEEPKEKSDGE
jgi:hypothetical protein